MKEQELKLERLQKELEEKTNVSDSKAGSQNDELFESVTKKQIQLLKKKAASKAKTTFQFYADYSKDEDEIRTAPLNKTFNGVKFEEVFVINMQHVTIA